MEEDRDREAAEVAEVADAIVAGTGVPYTFERRKGAPAQAILTATSAAAAATGTDPVIVVGRSGHTLHHVLGSVPVQLLHHSAYPVMTIP
jgi:nucleotide-binding universal stress UspA family protein